VDNEGNITAGVRLNLWDNDNNKPLSIGSNFHVEWDGTVYAKNL
jgi:hypothetical protein